MRQFVFAKALPSQYTGKIRSSQKCSYRARKVTHYVHR